MNTKQVRSILSDVIDTISFRDNTFTVKKSYFWGATKDGSTLAKKVEDLLPGVKVIDYGNHYHAFVGGAKPGSAQDSYLYCKFKF